MKTNYRWSFLVGIVVVGIVGISGCQPVEFTKNLPASPILTSTATSTDIPIPTWLTDLPAGMVAVLDEAGNWDVEGVAPIAPQERPPVTAERVKNIGTSLEIGLDDEKNLIGLLEDTTQDKKDYVKAFYEAIQKRFPTSTVFYDQDPETSGQWILYATLGGRLFQETVSYSGGPEQYFDYPLSFNDTNGYWEIEGNYQALEVPGNGQIGVIWDSGLPQLLTDKVTLPNGDSYFKSYMNYKTYAEDRNPWQEVSGVAEIIATSPTETPSDIEKDLNPAYTETVSQEFMGVKINAELITDASLNSEITKVTVPENIYAEFIARTLFKVWWTKGAEAHTKIATEDDFKAFMTLWSQAQTSGLEVDWRKVQIDNIWANNLNDGNRYIQEAYSIWPMYEGEALEGIRGIDKMNVAFVRSSGVHNITIFNELDIGNGTNMDEKSLIVYIGLAEANNPSKLTKTTAEACATVSWWLIQNSGIPITGYPMQEDKAITKILLSGGLKVYP